MNTQPEALRFAERIDPPQIFVSPEMRAAAAAELRRLHEVNTELLEALQLVVTLADEMHTHWDNDHDAKVGKCLLALSNRLPRYDKRFDSIHAAIAKATGEQP
jgi:hypothetical protein